MASTEVIVLSSSPATSFIATTPSRPHLLAPMASSPGFPSPSQLLSKKQPLLTSGNWATALPEGALQGFATASSLLRQAYAIRRDEEITNQEKGNANSLAKKQDVTEKPTKKIVSKKQPSIEKPANEKKARVAKAALDTVPIKPRALRKKAQQQETKPAEMVDHDEGQAVTKVRPARKPRAKKGVDGAQAQAKTKKAKVIRATSADIPAKVDQIAEDFESLQTSNTDRGLHGQGVRENSVQENPAKPGLDKNEEHEFEKPKGLGLSKILARRRDWTPVKDALPVQEQLTVQSPMTFKQPGTSVKSPRCRADEATFGNLISEYKYAQSAEGAVDSNAPKRNREGEAVTKRRKLNFVNTTTCPLPATDPARRTKPLKKKPQTVTAKATESFVPDQQAESPSLLQYFASPTEQHNQETALLIRETGEQPMKKRRKKSAVKPSNTKTKKQTSRMPVLLPPEQALAATNNQDLLFGTSSQLAREESPTFIRELQQAIKASEAVAEPVRLTEPMNFAESIMSGSSTTSNVSLMTSSRNLWSVAARNTDGTLLEAEFINLVDTPQAKVVLREDLEKVHTNNAILNKKVTDDNSAWTILNDLAMPCGTNTLKDPAKTPMHTHEFIPIPLPRSVAEAALRPRTKSRSPVKRIVPPATDQIPTDVVDQKPDFKGYTTSKLSKAITAYGFKPVKNRDTMIGLLEKCWEGKTRLALQSLPANTNIPRLESDGASSEKPPSPAKRKGRPSKTKNPPAIADGALSVTQPPAKPRGRPRKATVPSTVTGSPEKRPATALQPPPTKTTLQAPPTPPPPANIQDPSPFTTLPLPLPLPTTPSSTHTALLSAITQAITTHPPTHDAQNLTWNEKILLYDPIVLEDLAAWLNTEGLGAVGVDEEVGVGVMREWCEGRSVCWVWRCGWRGGGGKGGRGKAEG